MTLQECISRINDEKINAYSDEQKTKWINTINKQVHTAMKLLEDDYKDLEYPLDQDTELLIKTPYDEIYDYYCYSKIDLLNNEIQTYNNSNILFNTILEEYKKYLIRSGYYTPSTKLNNYEP